MDTIHDVINHELATEALGLLSRSARDRRASMQLVIAAGLAAKIPVDVIRAEIAQELGVLLAGSREGAPLSWSDANERDFCVAFDEARSALQRSARKILVAPSAEDCV